MSAGKQFEAKSKKLAKPESVRCTYCGEGIGPGIRPKPDQHADALECFKAMRLAVDEVRDVLREIVADVEANDLRTIKARFAVETRDDGSYVWTVTVTDPLGDEDRMAKLVAHTWMAMYESSTKIRLTPTRAEAPTG